MQLRAVAGGPESAQRAGCEPRERQDSGEGAGAIKRADVTDWRAAFGRATGLGPRASAEHRPSRLGPIARSRGFSRPRWASDSGRQARVRRTSRPQSGARIGRKRAALSKKTINWTGPASHLCRRVLTSRARGERTGPPTSGTRRVPMAGYSSNSSCPPESAPHDRPVPWRCSTCRAPVSLVRHRRWAPTPSEPAPVRDRSAGRLVEQILEQHWDTNQDRWAKLPRTQSGPSSGPGVR